MKFTHSDSARIIWSFPKGLTILSHLTQIFKTQQSSNFIFCHRGIQFYQLNEDIFFSTYFTLGYLFKGKLMIYAFFFPQTFYSVHFCFYVSTIQFWLVYFVIYFEIRKWDVFSFILLSQISLTLRAVNFMMIFVFLSKMSLGVFWNHEVIFLLCSF